ncbi:MAG: flavodoxin family protein [Desulfovibrionaceae bacterium]|nr:flavodoxin family protein [Desulfovibrionaceae bacterium]
MGRHVLIVSSSLRGQSNSELMARELARGAEDSGHEVEFITLRGKSIGFCTGCFACGRTHACVLDDDANQIVERIAHADVLVFATPIYYYEVSGQLKTLLDRCTPLYEGEYRFRDVYLVAAAAEDDCSVPERAENALQGWTECFEKAEYRGCIFGGGVTNPGEIARHEDVIRQAYNMGRNIE